MSIAILYLKKDNKIHQFFPDVTGLYKSKVEFLSGSAEGWSEDEVGVIVVDSLKYVKEVKEVEIGEQLVEEVSEYLEGSNKIKYTYGNTLPSGLVDLSPSFYKLTPEEENAELKTRLMATEEALLEIILGGM